MSTNNKMSKGFKKPDESPCFLLWKVTNIWRSRMRMALGEIGMTHVQFVLLASTVLLNDNGMEASQVLRTLEKKRSNSKVGKFWRFQFQYYNSYRKGKNTG